MQIHNSVLLILLLQSDSAIALVPVVLFALAYTTLAFFEAAANVQPSGINKHLPLAVSRGKNVGQIKVIKRKKNVLHV